MNTFKGLDNAWDEPEEKEMYQVGDKVKIVNIKCSVLNKHYKEGEVVVITEWHGKPGDRATAIFADGQHWYIGGSACDVILFEEEGSNKYTHNIKGVNIDVYDVLSGFNVICPATQHAIKKLLMAGNRGQKSTKQDLEEAQSSIARALELLGK